EEIMLSINPSTLPKDILTDYYGQMIFLYSHLGNYTGGDVNDYYIKERAYKDSIVQIIDSRHPDYLWYKGWDILGTDKSDDKLIGALRDLLDKSELNTRKDAKDAYILAKLYEQKGDHDNFKKYMTISGIADVKIVNAEISSLEDLAKIMFAEGDVNRAYRYINYSLNKAISYPNRVKAYGITNTLDSINRAYQEQGEKQQRRTRFFLILVCLLAAVLTGAIATIIVQNSRLRRRRRNLDAANKSLNKNVAKLSAAQQQLNDANSQLHQLNTDLKLKNDELNEANYVKEEYIGYIFTICSNYISKLEELKRNIHIKAVTKKYKEIEAETADLDMKEELKDFYQSFDSIFLHIYPNFVNDFNSLLQDDKKIIPREGELLNTELRIYALVRLGITDSVKIAEFLHCSVQTVYNNRFRVRNKAIIPKKDFAESVRTLGHYLDRSS
ncbi:MAG: transcriptional regulator, partial [Muribaculaceae bacterium]|nr:transcriptional regulator [Muribaculaceae bacterium]